MNFRGKLTVLLFRYEHARQLIIVKQPVNAKPSQVKHNTPKKFPESIIVR